MADKLEFYFDFVSPYSYLASTQIGKLADRAGIDIVYRPVALLELMKLVGNRPTTVECKNKQKYAGADIRRWVAKYGVRMQPNPHFSATDKARLLRGALAAADAGQAASYVAAVFRGAWAEALNLGDAQVIAGLLDRAGLDGAKILQAADGDAYVVRLEEDTKTAAERGLFGVPSFLVGSELFFGNDRLDILSAALGKAA